MENQGDYKRNYQKEIIVITINLLKMQEIDTIETEYYDYMSLRYKSIDYKEYDLGEDLARDGLNNIRINSKDQKEIKCDFYDRVKGYERYLITERVAFFKLTRIKLPTIFVIHGDFTKAVNCFLMARKDGHGSLTLIHETFDGNVSTLIGKPARGIWIPNEFKKLFTNESLIEYEDHSYFRIKVLDLLDIYEAIIYSIFTDLVIVQHSIPFLIFQKINTKKLTINNLLDEFKIIGIRNKDDIYNLNSENEIINVSTMTTNHCFISDMFYFQNEKEKNDDLLTERFCLIEHFLIERNKLLSSISELRQISTNDNNLYKFKKQYLDLNNIDIMFNFSISTSIKFCTILRESLMINILYEEVAQLTDYYLSNIQIQRRIIEEDNNKQIRKTNELVKIISMIALIPVIFTIIELFYNIEVDKFIFYPMNLSKFIAFIILIVMIIAYWIKYLFTHFKNIKG